MIYRAKSKSESLLLIKQRMLGVYQLTNQKSLIVFHFFQSFYGYNLSALRLIHITHNYLMAREQRTKK